MFFYGSECLALTKEHIGRMDTGESRFLIAVVGYRMTDHKRNEDIPEELGITEP
jgi:hypothetical protein